MNRPPDSGSPPPTPFRRPVPRPRAEPDRTCGFTLVELLVVIVIIGILAAIALPKFGDARERAFFAAMQSDLRSLALQQEIHYADAFSYSGNADSLNFRSSDGVTVTINASSTGWSAMANHEALGSDQGCMTYSGSVTSKPTLGSDTLQSEGQITCVR